MDWITGEVAIGNYRDVESGELLAQHGIRSVLSLDGTLKAGQAGVFGLSEIATYRLIDGAGNDPRVFRLAIEDLRRMVATAPPVLVQCHAGRSRSASVVAGYLMLVHGVEAEQALQTVAARRAIHVASALIELLDKLGR